MNKLKKMITFLLVICLVAGSLSACGKKDDSGESSETAAATEASAPADAVHKCVGYWKYDEYPNYIIITNDLKNVGYDENGNVIGQGTITIIDDESFILSLEGSDRENTYTMDGENKMVDQDGDTVSRLASLSFAPTSDDPLSETAYFPGKFEGFSVNYPGRMSAVPHTKVANALNFFNKAVPNGSPDKHSFITMSFHPLVNSDEYLTKGAYLAKPALTMIMNNAMQTLYGDYLIKSLGTDFQDKGSYYSVTGYMALSSKLFVDPAEGETLMGIMELRYFGPTGYILACTSVAPVDSIENYYKISLNMLDTCTYKTDWSTQPPAKKAAKTSQPVKKSKTKQVTTKKASKQTTVETYYWTDADGDVWYFNGYEDIFYCFGSDGYIDDDGDFMESNDAGWDFDEYDYDDELEFNDYDELYDSYLYDEDYDDDDLEYNDYYDYDYSDYGDYDYDDYGYDDYSYDYGGYDDYGYDDYGDDW